MHLQMNGTEVSIKAKSSPVCFVFLKIKTSLHKNAGFPKRRLSHAICHVVKFPKPVKTSLPIPKVFTKVCTSFDVTNLSLFYRWVSKISYPWDFASAPLCACICNYLRRDDETFCVESGYIYFSSL